VRIETLSYSNVTTQGAQRRQWLREHAPRHLERCTDLVLSGVRRRAAAASRSTVVLGAGACTEVPLAELVRASEEVVLVDLDLVALLRGRNELTAPSQRNRVRLIQGDITGGVSAALKRLLQQQDWQGLREQGAMALFDAAAQCVEQCRVPDPPELETLADGDCGLVISSLVVSQLFGYPLLDVLDIVQDLDPGLLVEQERHRRYQEASQAFRVRVIRAHLHLLRSLLDRGGVAVLLSDIRGFVFSVQGTDHDARHRRVLPLVPRQFGELVREVFEVVEEGQWEWLTDLPTSERPGRGYEIAGYVLAGRR
jgi:hypothetical protein